MILKIKQQSQLKAQTEQTCKSIWQHVSTHWKMLLSWVYKVFVFIIPEMYFGTREPSHILSTSRF